MRVKAAPYKMQNNAKPSKLAEPVVKHMTHMDAEAAALPLKSESFRCEEPGDFQVLFSTMYEDIPYRSDSRGEV